MSVLKARFEYFVAGLALTVVAVMVPWWAVLARRLVTQNIELREKLAFASTGIQLDLGPEADHLHSMLTTEFAAIASCMAIAVAALFAIARQRSIGQHRMERLLQFTSHELKTPIAGVRALLQSLGLGSVPPERQQEFINRGLAEVDRLEHLTETILAWQRTLASETNGVQASRSSAPALVNEILDHRRRTGVAESVELAAIAPVDVVVDSDAFRVILENLLDNARKYGGGATRIISEVKGREWLLSVIDHGQGFRSADAERLFDPFRRQSHEGVTHGSGLGLYLSRQLALRMQGRLVASSDGPGRGSVFTLAVPMGGSNETRAS